MPSEPRTYHAKQYASEILDRPEPPETFFARETPWNQGDLLKLRIVNVLVRVDRDPEKGNEWKIHPQAYEAAREHFHSRDGFSCCGNTGIVNRDGTLYCKHCDAPVSEDEYMRVMTN